VEAHKPELLIGARALRDPQFREALLSRPEATLEREYGIATPEGVRIMVHEETDEVVHLVIPGRPSWAERVPDIELLETILLRAAEKADTSGCCTCGSSTAQTLTTKIVNCPRGCT
jgi:Nitrile hydratase, alpha chain